MKKVLASLATVAMVLSGAMAVAPVYATGGVDNANSYISDANDGNSTDLMGTIKVIVNVVLGIVGLIAVVVIIVGGINFTTSQGDAGKVKKARDTILYGIIGLVVALLAFAIVNFVMSNVFA